MLSVSWSRDNHMLPERHQVLSLNCKYHCVKKKSEYEIVNKMLLVGASSLWKIAVVLILLCTSGHLLVSRWGVVQSVRWTEAQGRKTGWRQDCLDSAPGFGLSRAGFPLNTLHTTPGEKVWRLLRQTWKLSRCASWDQVRTFGLLTSISSAYILMLRSLFVRDLRPW